MSSFIDHEALAAADENARAAFSSGLWFVCLFEVFCCNFAFFAFNDQGSKKQRPFLSTLCAISNAAVVASLLAGQWTPYWNIAKVWLGDSNEDGFTREMKAIPDSAKVWMWWSALCAISLCNILFLAYVLITRKSTATDDRTKRYERRLKFLAIPFVFTCAFRSVLPEVYAGDCLVEGEGCLSSRLVFFDHWINGVLVGRGLACFAEVCLVVQAALVVHRLNLDLGKFGSSYISAGTWVMPLLAVIAEICSYSCTFTTNNLFCAAENSFWTAKMCIAVVSCLYLYIYIGKLNLEKDARSARAFTVCTMLTGCVYVPFMMTDDVPMYVSRYYRDVEMKKHFFTFYDGMIDSAYRRDATQDYSVWAEEMVWRGVYFSAVVWASILMAHAPRIIFPSTKKSKTKIK